MLKRHVCPKCSHNKILMIRHVADAGDGFAVRPMQIAIAFAGQGFFSDRTEGAGSLSAVVCKGCGYTELYTRDPEAIPIDGTYVTEISGPDPEAPYR